MQTEQSKEAPKEAPKEVPKEQPKEAPKVNNTQMNLAVAKEIFGDVDVIMSELGVRGKEVFAKGINNMFEFEKALDNRNKKEYDDALDTLTEGNKALGGKELGEGIKLSLQNAIKDMNTYELVNSCKTIIGGLSAKLKQQEVVVKNAKVEERPAPVVAPVKNETVGEPSPTLFKFTSFLKKGRQ